MIDQLRNANRESLLAAADGMKTLSMQHKGTLYGWDPHKRSAVPVLSSEEVDDDSRKVNDARILDSLQAKKDALVLAVESVCSLLGIASVVRVP